MGKKRRAIHRSSKFMTKYFQFLDNIDGANDESLDSTKLEARFQSVEITDIGNQTFKFTAFAQGPGDTTTGKLDSDIVKFSVDGNSTTLSPSAVDAGNVFITADGSGRKKYRAVSADPAIIDNTSAVTLAVGEHTLVCTLHKEDGTARGVEFTQKFSIARSDLNIPSSGDGSLDDAISFDAVNGQFDFDLTVINPPGKRAGETTAYRIHHTSDHRKSFRLTAVNTTDAENPVDLTLKAFDTHEGGIAGEGREGRNRTGTVDNQLDILDAALAAGDYEVTFTFIPRDASDADLTEDAVTVVKTVTSTKAP